MKDQLARLPIAKAEPLYRQIERHVRNLLVSGEYPPDTKLPPTQELAALWHTQALTIHTALAPLVKEGLLVRYPRRGTFVRRREQKLTCVGIYDLAGTLRESLFEQALHAGIKEQLTAAGIEMDVWLDPRPQAEQGEPWLPLVRAAERREFQALIATSTDWPHLSWQRRLPVPTAFCTSANIPNGVGADYAQFAELSVRTLVQQGCRSVGLICPLSVATTNAEDSRHGHAGFYERLMDLISDLGLTVKNEWMRLPTAQITVTEQAQERFGYEEFLKLWSQPEKPSGLIVYPDTTARGAILGLREQQVRVPAELKLVLHKNEAVDLLCPMPATFAVLSERVIAQALIEQVQKQFRGEVCEPVMVPFRLEDHRGSSPQLTNNQPERERSQS